MKTRQRSNEFRNIIKGSEPGSFVRFQGGHAKRYGKDAEIAALKRQRDELHETANRYLARARRAEAFQKAWREAYERQVVKIDEFSADVDAGRILVFKVTEVEPTPVSKWKLWLDLAVIFGFMLIGGGFIAFVIKLASKSL